MNEMIISIWVIAAIFFFVALAYSSVGLGGGSSYTALLVVFGFSALSIPLISLALNLLVTSIGSFNFIRHGHLRIRLIFPFIISSIPMAWIGGLLQVSEEIFQIILFFSLILVLFRIYFWTNTQFRWKLSDTQKLIVSIVSGAILGLLAGLVGIGGGIYLVPLIIMLGLGTMKEAAACGAVFIWINSLIGLISRFQFNFIDLTPYLPLLITVVAGGLFGSLLGSRVLSGRVMEKVLGSVVVIAVFLLGRTLLYS